MINLETCLGLANSFISTSKYMYHKSMKTDTTFSNISTAGKLQAIKTTAYQSIITAIKSIRKKLAIIIESVVRHKSC